MRNLITKAKAAHLKMRVRRFLLLGCDFSLLGLHYSLRKPEGANTQFIRRAAQLGFAISVVCGYNRIQYLKPFRRQVGDLISLENSVAGLGNQDGEGVRTDHG
jgi:hypothetical protein